MKSQRNREGKGGNLRFWGSDLRISPMDKKRRVGVIYGGWSSEREISHRTGEGVIRALRERGYRVWGIDVDAELPAKLINEGIEVVFNALHGRWGEDGCVQGLLEVMRIPYTGSGVLASALGMDKLVSRIIFREAGISVPAYVVVERQAERIAFSSIERRLGGYPLIVKPRSEGSSIGVEKATNRGELRKAVENAFQYGGEVLVEKFIKGQEVHVGLLNGEILGDVEVIPRSGFYDYQAKYTPGYTDYKIPARISRLIRKRIHFEALKAYKVIGCEGAVRVDFIVCRNKSYLLEVNTLPGLTATSLIPKLAAFQGIDYSQLVETILRTARLKIPVIWGRVDR